VDSKAVLWGGLLSLFLGATPKIKTIWFSESFGHYAAAIAAISKDEDHRQQLLYRRFP